MTSRKSAGLTCLLSITVSLSSGTFAAGAVVDWGAPQTISGDTDVLTSGTLEFAYNLGGTGTASTTLNGQTFAPFVVSTPTPSVTIGRLNVATFNPLDPTPISMSGIVGATSNSAPYSLLSANYKALASGGVGQHVAGTFVANATTQSINFSTGGSGQIVFNAIQLRASAVPELSSFGLLAACSLAFIGWRHRLFLKRLGLRSA